MSGDGCAIRMPETFEQDVLSKCRLSSTDLNENGIGVVDEMVTELSGEAAIEVEAVFATIDGELGFVGADLIRKRLVLFGGDVGKIRENDVERLDERFEHVAGKQDDTIDRAKLLAVLARPLQRLGGLINGEHLCSRRMTGDGNRDSATTGANVSDAHEPLVARVLADRIERGFDERFGLWTGDECARADLEGEAVELSLAKDVGERFVGEATDQQPLEDLKCRGIARSAAGSDHMDTIEVSGEAVEQLHLKPCFIEVFGAPHFKQLLGSALNKGAQRVGAVSHGGRYSRLALGGLALVEHLVQDE